MRQKLIGDIRYMSYDNWSREVNFWFLSMFSKQTINKVINQIKLCKYHEVIIV